MLRTPLEMICAAQYICMLLIVALFGTPLCHAKHCFQSAQWLLALRSAQAFALYNSALLTLRPPC